MLGSHSINFTRAQGISKYNIGLGKGKDGRVGGGLVEGGGGGATSLALRWPLASGQFKNGVLSGVRGGLCVSLTSFSLVPLLHTSHFSTRVPSLGR
jgi:hypothetical protein